MRASHFILLSGFCGLVGMILAAVLFGGPPHPNQVAQDFSHEFWQVDDIPIPRLGILTTQPRSDTVVCTLSYNHTKLPWCKIVLKKSATALTQKGTYRFRVTEVTKHFLLCPMIIEVLDDSGQLVDRFPFDGATGLNPNAAGYQPLADS